MKKSFNYWKNINVSIAYILPFVLLIVVYYANRSLFLDGLNLARNIAEGSFVDLTSPLKYEQSAPLLFLYISKFITLVFGISEYSLRLLPLFSGVACIYLFGQTLRRLLHTKYVLLGIVWFGTHAMVIRYATEFKQYITDAFVCILLIWLALKWDKLSDKNIYAVGLLGTISIWLSMPSVFVLFGLIIYYLHIQYKAKKSVMSVLVLGGWFVINFALEYLMILRPAIHSDHMQNFHQNYFLQGIFWDMDSLNHDFGLIVSMIRMAVGKSGIAIAVAMTLIAMSIYDLIKNKKSLGLLLILPIVAVLGASIMGKYSLIERLMLFSLPIIFLLILLGFQIVVEKLKAFNNAIKYSILGVIGIAFLAGFVQTQGLKYFITPLEIEDNRTSLTHINQHSKHANTIICTQLAFPAFSYYTMHDKNFKNMNLGNAIAAKYDESVVTLATNQSKKDEAEVWVLMGHMLESEISQLIIDLEKKGQIKNSYRTKRSAAILFSTQ